MILIFIIIIIIFFLYFNQYEEMANSAPVIPAKAQPAIPAKQLNTNEAINNLGDIAGKLLSGGATIPGNISISGVTTCNKITANDEISAQNINMTGSLVTNSINTNKDIQVGGNIMLTGDLNIKGNIINGDPSVYTIILNPNNNNADPIVLKNDSLHLYVLWNSDKDAATILTKAKKYLGPTNAEALPADYRDCTINYTLPPNHFILVYDWTSGSVKHISSDKPTSGTLYRKGACIAVIGTLEDGSQFLNKTLSGQLLAAMSNFG